MLLSPVLVQQYSEPSKGLGFRGLGFVVPEAAGRIEQPPPWSLSPQAYPYIAPDVGDSLGPFNSREAPRAQFADQYLQLLELQHHRLD